MRIATTTGLFLLSALLLGYVGGTTGHSRQSPDLTAEPPPIGPAVLPFSYVFVKKLNVKNFHSIFSEPHVKDFVVEFYAPWCPHCQHFAPTMEKVGYVYNVVSSPVHIASVDCVADPAICHAFHIDGYPMVKFASTQDWLSGFKQREPQFRQIEMALAQQQSQQPPRQQPQQQSQQSRQQQQPLQQSRQGGGRQERVHRHQRQKSSGVQYVMEESSSTVFSGTFEPETIAAGGGSVSELIEKINDRAGTSYNLTDDALFSADFQKRLLSQDNSSSAATVYKSYPHADLWDIQTATAMAINFIFDDSKYHEPSVNEDAVSFLALLCESFPSQGCQPAMCGLASKARKDKNLSWRTVYSQWQMCGEVEWRAYSKGWSLCKGSFPHSRGYTCGLWLLFHSLVVNLDDASTVPKYYSNALQSIRGFIANFFACVECRDHFLGLSKDYYQVETHREAVLFMWDKHNMVNKRVSGLEQHFGDGDPAFVKQPIPSYQQCPECGASKDGAFGAVWDQDKVYDWLMKYYRAHPRLNGL